MLQRIHTTSAAVTVLLPGILDDVTGIVPSAPNGDGEEMRKVITPGSQYAADGSVAGAR